MITNIQDVLQISSTEKESY